MKIRSILMVAAAAAAILCTGCATSVSVVKLPKFDCSPGKLLAVGVGDSLGSQLIARQNPGQVAAAALKAAKSGAALVKIDTNE